MNVVLGFLIGGIVGAVVGIFVYRNNEKKISKIYDKVDDIHGKLEHILKDD